MAAATTVSQIFENQNSNGNNTNHEIRRQEIQAAISKAVELRALHAALMQGNSPANLRFPSSSPASQTASQFSAQDYPVFTPVSINFLNVLHKFCFIACILRVYVLGFCFFKLKLNTCFTFCHQYELLALA